MYHLGRNGQSTFDSRDFALKMYMPPKIDITGEKEWEYNGLALNQRQTNGCVGFSAAGWGICDPVQDPFTDMDGLRIYKLCKIKDGEPDLDNGSTMRTQAQVLKDLGMIQNYAFAYTVEEVAWWILNRGPVLIGTDWTYGMWDVDGSGIIHPTGEVAGGHAYFFRGKTSNDYLRGRSSWGSEWGLNGEFFMSMEDVDKLLHHGGEAIAAVEVAPSMLPTGKENPCTSALMKLLGI
jgi:hypothetical protein